MILFRRSTEPVVQKQGQLHRGHPNGILISALAVSIMATAALGQSSTDSSANQSAGPVAWEPTYRSAGNRPGGGGASFQDLIQEGPTGGVWQRSELLGDFFGTRSALGQYGLTFDLVETSEVLGNVTGGFTQGADYDGLTTATLQLDTQRAFGLKGGLFNISGLDLHGSNLSANNLGTLQTSSGIEADRSDRLWELWYQQSFFYGKADIKIGQQSLDQEFMDSQYAGLFVNTMFGWPMLPSADLLSGGPAYPLSSLGVRIRGQAIGPWAVLAGVFDDNPSGLASGSDGDSQVLDNHGINFRLRDNPLFIAEVQYSRPALGSLEYNDGSGALAGTYRFGFWYDAGSFADQRYSADGLSLANPSSNGEPLLHKGNYSFYAVMDQLLWRESPDSEEGLGTFVRAMASPGDRNLIDFSLNAGLTYREPFEHREDDVVGLGMGYANVSGQASDLDRDTNFFTGVAAPVRTGETFVELTYQYQIVPWWTVQPDIQYVIRPGAGIANPSDPSGTSRVANELVVGIRTNITF
jgi:porin